jgi:putative transposase
VLHLFWIGIVLGSDALRFLRVGLRSRTARAAETLFLRKQLALYRERQVKPRQARDATRAGLVLPARFFAWKRSLSCSRRP